MDERIRTQPESWPGAESVIRRALCVGALVYQGVQEAVAQEEPSDKNLAEAETHLRWVREHLWEDLTNGERAALSMTVGRWREDVLRTAFARAEAFGVLAWALSLLPNLPNYDEEFDGGALVEAYESLRQRSAQPLLRDHEELASACGMAARWHSRATVRTGASRASLLFLLENRDENADPDATVGDFVLFGKPYLHLSEEEMERASTIAAGRHLAAAWLCGRVPDWDAAG